ncbi:MAG: DegT/DnrJ/EryC1/StrS aminotransferase family protein [Candidatus Eisenbacteria bacterium]|uniref:DegT/DnrJ/EryC1/StrS aminotransferase family protein n=1 Tax=Eiseniibacteriota bacterium TaxID=2212470 RepID=A0A849SD41_UNCEI|nr:DegT/DnrJ/EryC1/StrS aminotransferase family protein [Candidatus Eisenbacteria bacterium]
MRSEYLPVALPWIGEREKQLVLETLDSGWITTGRHAQTLGTRIAEMAGARHGLAVNSATGALHLALVALGVKRGDEVITSTYTFAACVNVIEHVGATPVLVDIEPDTLCLDPRAVEAAITPRTRAILSVDYAGHPADYRSLLPLAERHGLPIIEDAAHALGARLDGRPVGSWATITAFSFYATKNLTTGEGGAAVTNDPKLAEQLAILSLHGMNRDAWKRYTAAGSWYYEVTLPGYKYNLSDVLAAIGVGQLERFEEFQRIRGELVAHYHRRLSELPEIRRPITREGVEHAWHLYPIGLELERLTIDRARFIQELRAENVGTSVHFIPIHRHPHFRDTFGFDAARFPVAEDAYERAITLPLFPRMTERDVDQVCEAVAKVVAHFRR